MLEAKADMHEPGIVSSNINHMLIPYCNVHVVAFVHQFTVDCNDIGRLAKIGFNISGTLFELTPEQYVVKVSLVLQLDNYNNV